MNTKTIFSLLAVFTFVFVGCAQNNSPTSPKLSSAEGQFSTQTWIPADTLLAEEFAGVAGQPVANWYGGSNFPLPVYGQDGNSARMSTQAGSSFTVITHQITNANLFNHNRLRLLVNKISSATSYTVIVNVPLENGQVATWNAVHYATQIGYTDIEIPWEIRYLNTGDIDIQIQMDYQSQGAYLELGEIFIYADNDYTVYYEEQFGNGSTDHPEGWWDAITYNYANPVFGQDFNTDMKRTVNDTASIELINGGQGQWGKVISPPVHNRPYAFNKLSFDVVQVNNSGDSHFLVGLREQSGQYNLFDLTGTETVNGNTYTYDLSNISGLYVSSEISVEISIANTSATPYLEIDNVKLHR